MTPISRRILFTLVTISVIFGAIEMGLSLSGWPNTEATFDHNEPFWVVDSALTNKAFPHKEESTSFLVSTNSDGLRSPDSTPENTNDRFRIMTLGCSTTFGWGVENNQTYPSRLQHYLDEEDPQSIEVINGGQPGYTSFQGAWLWENTLQHYNPEVVLIGYVVQDARKAAYTDKSQAILQGDNRFLKDHFLYRMKSYMALRAVLGSIQIQAKERGEGDEGGVFRVPPEDYVQNIRALISSIEAQGGTPVLFGYPLERSGYTEMHRKILASAGEELDVLFLDVQERMEQATQTGEYYFKRDRGHANADGNELIAKWVFDYLKEQDLLGQNQ